MKIEPYMLDYLTNDSIIFDNICWWSRKNITGFTKKFPQPTKHSSKINSYLAYCEEDSVKYWTIELCSDCNKIFRKKHSAITLTKLTVKDLFYLKLIDKYHENNY